MRFCVQCGTALPRGAAFCTQCGAQAAPSSAPTSGEDAPTQMTRAPRDPQEQPGTRLPGTGDSRSGASPQNDSAGGNASTPQGYSDAANTGPVAPASSGGSIAGQRQSSDTSSEGDASTQNAPAQHLPSGQPTGDSPDDLSAGRQWNDPEATHAIPQQHDQQGTWHSSSPIAQDDDVTRMAPIAGTANPGRDTRSSAPVTQQIPQQPGAPQPTQDDDATHFAPPSTSPQNERGDASTPPAEAYRSAGQGYAAPDDDTHFAPSQGHASTTSAHDDDATRFAPPTPGYPSSQSGPTQGYPSAEQSRQRDQAYTSAMPSNAHQGYPAQQYASAQPERYASQQPQQSWAPPSQQGLQAHHGQPGVDQPGAGPSVTNQPGPNGPMGNGSGQGLALDWKPLLPGLLRAAAAILLSMTALGNWWMIDLTASRDDFATHSSVLPLIGCIGVTLAALAQVALLPQFLGAAVPAIGRFAIRVGLCVPALLAVIIAIVTTLGGSTSEKFPGIGVTMLAMAVGFAVMGLDDGHDIVPPDTLRWVTAAMAGLGIALMFLSFIHIVSGDASTEVTTKYKWLFSGVSFLFLALVGALIIWVAIARPPFGLGLITALTAGATVSALLLGWVIADATLYLVHLNRTWHGGPLLALALAMAASRQVGGRVDDAATDDGAQARRLTAWTPYGYGLAALGALVTAFAFIGVRREGTPTGFTWFAILMFVTAALYAACAYLLKTHPLGRLIAVGATALVTLTVFITFASAEGVGSVNEMFSEGAYLWVPVIAALALTVPPSVRRVSGSILPQQRSGSGQPAMQSAGVPAQQYGSQPQQPGAQASYPSVQPSADAPTQFGQTPYNQTQNSQTQHGQGGYQSQGYEGHGNGSAPNPSTQDLAPNEWEERTQLNRRNDER